MTELIVLKTKPVRQVVQISTEIVCFGILVSIMQSLESPGESRGNLNCVLSMSFLCLTAN